MSTEKGLPGDQPQPQDDRPLGQDSPESAGGVPLTPQTNDPIQQTQPGYPSERAGEVIGSLEEQAATEEGGEAVQTDTENFAADPNPRTAKEQDPAEGWKRNKNPRAGDSGEHSPAVDERLPNP